jgi:hypothetical protein
VDHVAHHERQDHGDGGAAEGQDQTVEMPLVAALMASVRHQNSVFS